MCIVSTVFVCVVSMAQCHFILVWLTLNFPREINSILMCSHSFMADAYVWMRPVNNPGSSV